MTNNAKLVAAILAVMTVCATGLHNHGNDVAIQLRELNTYMKDLEFIEEEEELQGISTKDTISAEKEVLIKTCELAMDAIKIEVDGDFEELVKKDLSIWNECLRLFGNIEAVANWDFETDITDEHELALSKVSLRSSLFGKGLVRNAEQYIKHNKYATLDSDLQRQLRLMAVSTDLKDENETKELIEVQNSMQKTYSMATVDGLQLDPDLSDCMAHSRDADKLLHVWRGWRDVTGPPMRQDYSKNVHFLNKGAREHGFTDYADAWKKSQFDETDDLEDQAEKLWDEILPLYQQLHAYLRTKLNQTYPQYNSTFQAGGIPAHLSGNMWAQNWENIYDLVKPYPQIEEPDLDAEMKRQGYTVDGMFQMAESFYKSIGLFPMSSKFNEYSMKVRPANKDVVCHASASDFYTAKPPEDVRIKMCTTISMDSEETIHHEMGHIEYFMAYQDQPTIYRTGANSGFHEAIGDTASLSFRSIKHLKTIGLLHNDNINNIFGNSKQRFSYIHKEREDNYMREMNFLLKRALFKIAFLPFGYIIDKWRWSVFRGSITEENYNMEWWKLRLKYQGLVAPVERSEDDFDPGAKYHIPSNSPYICYFISFIVQFQFYEAMCKESGHSGPLHKCDFYESVEAGQKLKEMMMLGKSVPWPEAMEKLTGSKTISSRAIRSYFQPLYGFLLKENARTGAHIGWEDAKINWKTGIYKYQQ